MCSCYRNWQGADCSLRTCPFGLAHVDTPKGDLDGSGGALSAGSNGDNGAPVLIGSEVYPYGTTEAYPWMGTSDIQGSETQLDHTAHAYMECSNKGICDRKGGECECFEGYEGSACQRASCPNDCSGHGTCETIRELAEDEYSNVYMLWDRDLTMGCACDAGYSGPDCSSRQCKMGIDPLYIDDASTARVNTVKVEILGTASDVRLSGTYAIKFYDAFGEDYVTGPIAHDATTAQIKAALIALPNQVIPDVKVNPSGDERANAGTARTTAWDTGASGDSSQYTITFTNNPGALREIEIIDKLDGERSTLATNWLSTKVYSEGVHGEFTDFFAQECVGVQAGFGDCPSGASACGYGEASGLTDMTTAEWKLLKKCLGDSDGDVTNNVEVYNWDYGDMMDWAGATAKTITKTMGAFPHVFKAVPALPSSDLDGGLYFLGWWHNKAYAVASGAFDYLTGGTDVNQFKIASVGAPAGQYKIFTTDGTAQVLGFEYAAGSDNRLTSVSYDAAGLGAGVYAKDDLTAGNYSEHRVFAHFTQGEKVVYTNFDTSCETTALTYAAYADPHGQNLPIHGGSPTAAGYVRPCLEKGNWVFLFQLNVGTNSGTVAHEFLDGGNGVTAASSTHAAKTNTGNLYQITKIFKAEEDSATWGDGGTPGLTENKYRFTVDKSLSWDSNTRSAVSDSIYYQYSNTLVVLFTPASSSSYTYVAECSNRGACDADGLCECYKGYTGDDCSQQSSLAA